MSYQEDVADSIRSTTPEVPVQEVHVKINKEDEDHISRSSSIRFGNDNFNTDADVTDDASWNEVVKACCCHSSVEWLWIFLGVCSVVFFLYFFLLGLELLASGARVMSGCKAGTLFGNDANPVASLMVGILSTVLVQSSSTTTSIIVSLVGESGVLSLEQAIYMVMGANIGTTVTNTIVALGTMHDGDTLERAFAGATVNDMFNFMSVAVLMPVEWATGYLVVLTGVMVKRFNGEAEQEDDWDGPIKRLVGPLGDRIIKCNKQLINAVADGSGSCASGDGFYPIVCDGEPTAESCTQVGLIACGSKYGCPAFFQEDASAHEDKVSGGVAFFIGICIIFFCLAGMVAVLQRMMLGMSLRIVHKTTDVNGYIAIAIGTGITIIVQSSSVTTSTLTPFVGTGALRLEQMYALTLGANIGTSLTAIMAALVSTGTEPLQVALAHLMFNLTGVIIFYPIPLLRNIPVHAARQLGKATRIWRGFSVLYIAVMFVLMPLLFLGLSALFEEKSKGLTVLGSFLTVILGLGLASTLYWCVYLGGRKVCMDCFEERERRRIAYRDLPEDMACLKSKVYELEELVSSLADLDDNESDPLTRTSDGDERNGSGT